MSNPRAPYIVRATPEPYSLKPGIHSHNLHRRRQATPQRFSGIHKIRLALLLIGIAALGYYGYSLCDEYVYQRYQNWAFDQGIAGHGPATFTDYVRARTPFGFLVGKGRTVPAAIPNLPGTPAAPLREAPPAVGAVLGRVEIARLNLAAVVREGVDAKVLSVAVGHVPSTALPGQPGNFAIAAHRDTLFRVLKDIQHGDLVSFESPSGTYTYKVVATKIVRPTDVTVLRPDGGGLIPPDELASTGGQRNSLLTMITCYPFYYVGSAPKRFIVEAELVRDSGEKGSKVQNAAFRDTDSAAPNGLIGASHAPGATADQQAASLRARHKQPSGHSGNARRASATSVMVNPPLKKHGFWHRLLHV
jgi:sortase A